MIVVSNAGPLIALARIGHFDLLRSLYGQVHVPPAVQREVVTMGQGRAGSSEIAAANWVHVVDVRDRTAVELLRGRLDAGESESIVLSLQLHSDLLLIDEAWGRRVAEARGLNRTGTIGTLIMAKKFNLAPAITPLLEQLQAHGFHMSEELYLTARSLAGESD